MPFSLPSMHSLRLPALLVLVLGMVIWGTADRLAEDTDRHFQNTGFEECLLAFAPLEDTSGDDPPGIVQSSRHACTSPANQVAQANSDRAHPQSAHSPGLPRAPPA